MCPATHSLTQMMLLTYNNAAINKPKSKTFLCQKAISHLLSVVDGKNIPTFVWFSVRKNGNHSISIAGGVGVVGTAR